MEFAPKAVGEAVQKLRLLAGSAGAIARLFHLLASSEAHEVLEQGRESMAGRTRRPARKRQRTLFIHRSTRPSMFALEIHQ
jgi:hypothetical protein